MFVRAEREKFIHVKEMRAVQRGLLVCGSDLVGSSCEIRTDNKMVRLYLHKGGGKVPDMSALAKKVWMWSLEQGVSLEKFTWVKGVTDNKLADWL